MHDAKVRFTEGDVAESGSLNEHRSDKTVTLLWVSAFYREIRLDSNTVYMSEKLSSVLFLTFNLMFCYSTHRRT